VSNDKWYGKGDFGALVFDKSIQLDDGSVLLYVLEKNDVEKYIPDEIKPMLKKETSLEKINLLQSKYSAWLQFYSSKLKKLKDKKPFSFTEMKMQAEMEHKKKLQRLGLPFKGINFDTKRPPRATHCWDCKDTLDSSMDLECKACNWILCKCGACGCGYAKRS
jgi:hypothetical protein